MIKNIGKIIVTTAILTVLPLSSMATTGTVSGSAVRLREEPSLTGKTLTLLDKGKTAEILEEKTGWYKITINDLTGYISAEYFVKNEETVAKVTENKSELKNVVIDTAVVNIRKEPTTNSTLLGQATKGQLLKVLSETEADDGTWYKVQLEGTDTGYVRADLITSDVSQAKSEGRVTASVVNIRKEPTTESESLGKLSDGTAVEINNINGSWYQVTYNDKTGYIHSDYVELVMGNVTSRSGSSSAKIKKVIDLAKAQLGKRYVWGTEGPNTFDCSGLTQYVYSKVGVSLNRVSGDQTANGVKVAYSDLQPGDLVFFTGINSSANRRISHVGIYIGNNEFIHAANSSRGVVKDSFDVSYYVNHFVTARRVIR
ncbi:MAG: SH3 domain-containing protein [Clostridia bacterium]|nr:SH3 domain-containing protein [Clostridia bacterium]